MQKTVQLASNGVYVSDNLCPPLIEQKEGRSRLANIYSPFGHGGTSDDVGMETKKDLNFISSH